MKIMARRTLRFVALTLSALAMLGYVLNKNSEHGKLALSAYWNHLPERQVQRQSLLRRQCRHHHLGNINNTFTLSRLNRKVKLLYSDRYKFILCEIPKCASSSMKKLLVTTEKLVDITDATKVESAMAHTLADSMLDLRRVEGTDGVPNRIRSYKKLLIVRNPLYRLLSAYRNKLKKEYPWSKSFADMSRQIHSKFSTNDTGGQLATFSEFLRFAAADSDRDRHWELYNNLCLPCTIKYDFVAHVETIQDDMASFMEMISMKQAAFPSNYDAARQTDNAKFMRYMNEVPTNVVDEVLDNYRVDFELFGFTNAVSV